MEKNKKILLHNILTAVLPVLVP